MGREHRTYIIRLIPCKSFWMVIAWRTCASALDPFFLLELCSHSREQAVGTMDMIIYKYRSSSFSKLAAFYIATFGNKVYNTLVDSSVQNPDRCETFREFLFKKIIIENL